MKDSTISFQRYLENKGLGPAIIKRNEITYKNKDYKLDFRDFINEKFPLFDEYTNLQMTTSLTDLSISPNEKVTIFNLEIDVSKLEEAYKYMDIDTINHTPNWIFKMEYTSMYEDEVWNIDSEKNVPF